MTYSKRNPNGRASSANSSPVVISTEDAALFTEIAESHVGGATDLDNGVARDIVGNVAEKFKDGAVTTAAVYTSGNYTITSVGINGVN